ncbi:unnamed protein product [Polarella glacialis]|uniref:H(+)-exporting diphosphatase n=1 Tax=Polarella glacialis TaxID=89957 RepID=A0A813GHJ6_POLGL|nr:unnamed protein product [Polarella glacialis]
MLQLDDEQASVKGAKTPSLAGTELAQKRNIQAIINQSLVKKTNAGHKDDVHPLRRIGFSSQGSVIIHRGRFSWTSAFFMCFFVIGAFASAILMFLSLRNTTWSMTSEEISYIDAPNPPWDVPPWGFVKQPNGATSRKIGKKFRYAMPQFLLYYSIFSACFGLFCVAYFCSETLVQDRGVEAVRDMGELTNKGVDVYLFHTVPILAGVIIVCCGVIYFIQGLYFVISMVVGSTLCLGCSNMGINMNFEGGPRLCHALNYDLVASLQMAIRIGAIGGMSAHSMAQLGVVIVWMAVGDANGLVGFCTGVSIVSFFNRVAGGIFAKGSDIGSDFVSEMLGLDVDDFQMDRMEALKSKLADQDGDGDVDPDEDYRRKQNIVGFDATEDEQARAGFITEQEAAMREDIEKQMFESLATLHPVNYLDQIGENIADIGGTCSDLFETMVITLACGVILGSKMHEAPCFATGLPFVIISTGTIGCSMSCFFVWAHEHHSAKFIRRSVQLNLFMIMIFVQGAVFLYCYLHWSVWQSITYDRLIRYNVIVGVGLLAPEICAGICEYFTSPDCGPVSWLAKDSHLGMIQVILQGLGQGFASAGIPSVINIVAQILAFRWEGFYGLLLLACSSQACTGWQASLAAFGAVANNANRMVHLSTVNEMAQHRGNVLASLGTVLSHNGKSVAAQNAFFATSALIGALLADKRTKQGLNFQSTNQQELSEFARAGLLASVVFAMLFLSNTLTSTIQMAKLLVAWAKEHPTEVAARPGMKFPQSHLMPLKKLVAFCAIESFQLAFSPMCQTFAAPLVIGQLFGFRGLLMLVSGGNSVCFSLNMFLINSGQAWDAARKYVLFGMLKDEKGNVVSSESDVYEFLGIGEQIGGPLEDLCGPSLDNFIKFIVGVSFVTAELYDETPDKTWQAGIAQVFINFGLIGFFKFGLKRTLHWVEGVYRRRQEAIEWEEGTLMLREIKMHSEKLKAKQATRTSGDHELILN